MSDGRRCQTSKASFVESKEQGRRCRGQRREAYGRLVSDTTGTGRGSGAVSDTTGNGRG
ncbi:MAG: hypothetical protein LBK25_09760 [Treponema sp.]|nr:hypothetical protein [Treponema sp.]